MKKKSVQGCRVSYRWIDAIPEIFGEKWKKEGLKKGHEEGLEKGREETTYAITIKMVQRFPDWSNAKIAEFVGVTDKFVQQVRRKLAKEK